MRILMCAGFYDVGGSTIVIEKLSAALSNKGHEVTIGALWFKCLPPKGKYDVVKIPITNIFKLKQFLGFFDIVHSHHPLTNYLSLFCHKPFIYHYHGVPNFRTGFVFNLSSYLSLVLLRNNFNVVLAVSKSAVEQLNKFFKLDYVKILDNGVDFCHFSNPPLKKQLRKGRPQFLFVGNLYPHKNVEEIILAMFKLINFYPEAHLQIVGTGKMYFFLKKLIKDLKLENHVNLAGNILHTNLPAYYSSCDVYVTASHYETFGLPLLEAMASGKPVVASSILPHIELISESEAGEIYKLSDTQDFCRKMIYVYENREAYTLNAIRFAKNYDWALIAEMLLKIYYPIINFC